MCCSGSVAPEGEDEEEARKEAGCMLRLSTHPYFERIFIGAILLNTLVLMMEYEGMSSTYEDSLEVTNIVLTFSFIFEMAVKIIGLGCAGYFHDRFNCFDFFIVCTSIIELLVSPHFL